MDGHNDNHSAAPTVPQSQAKWQVLPLLLIVLAGITGNLLVCIAIYKEKKLQNITNYFLMSLSVADLFVSCIVMPLGMMNEFMGEYTSRVLRFNFKKHYFSDNQGLCYYI